jgi:hypothetical protein
MHIQLTGRYYLLYIAAALYGTNPSAKLSCKEKATQDVISASQRFQTSDLNFYIHKSNAHKGDSHPLVLCEDEIHSLGTLSEHPFHPGRIPEIFHSSWRKFLSLVSEYKFTLYQM